MYEATASVAPFDWRPSTEERERNYKYSRLNSNLGPMGVFTICPSDSSKDDKTQIKKAVHISTLTFQISISSVLSFDVEKAFAFILVAKKPV